jgi:hypothetical protein
LDSLKRLWGHIQGYPAPEFMVGLIVWALLAYSVALTVAMAWLASILQQQMENESWLLREVFGVPFR